MTNSSDETLSPASWTPNRELLDPEEADISAEERATRIGMVRLHRIHPDFTDRELRMQADIDLLVSAVMEGGAVQPELLNRITQGYDNV